MRRRAMPKTTRGGVRVILFALCGKNSEKHWTGVMSRVMVGFHLSGCRVCGVREAEGVFGLRACRPRRISMLRRRRREGSDECW
jgi:hypothetical protein